jgi:peptide/nickel transport system substrate-binding protein
MSRKPVENPFELDRRTFLTGAAATGAAAVVGVSCASAAPGTTSARALRMQDGEPTIIIGTLGEAQTINPFLSANESESDWRCKMLYDELVHINPATYAPEPGIAESWTIDNLTFTFKIRDNATFSDGADLTADDVAFTYEQ